MENTNKCPVRLYKLLVGKRTDKIKTDRFFITPKPWFKKTGMWYKNCPVGQNKMSKWTKMYAQKAGLDTKRKQKITNHSARSTAVSNMVQDRIQKQELIKITGHASAASLKAYLHISKQHYSSIGRW